MPGGILHFIWQTDHHTWNWMHCIFHHAIFSLCCLFLLLFHLGKLIESWQYDFDIIVLIPNNELNLSKSEDSKLGQTWQSLLLIYQRIMAMYQGNTLTYNSANQMSGNYVKYGVNYFLLWVYTQTANPERSTGNSANHNDTN